MPKLSRLASATAALVLLAACSDSAVAPSAPEPSAPSLARGGKSAGTSVSVATCEGTTISLTADEKRTLDLHNQERASKGLKPFCVHSVLTAAARSHSQEMIAKNYFAHESFNGDPSYVRVESFGYVGFWAENLGWGSGTYGSPESVFATWKGSAGHYANIVEPMYTQVGIGVASGRFQGYSDARVYTVDFGAP